MHFAYKTKIKHAFHKPLAVIRKKIHWSQNRIFVSPRPQILSTFDLLSVRIRKKSCRSASADRCTCSPHISEE